MMTDPIADMLTRIRNAHMAHKSQVELAFSKVKKAVADILLAEGYLGKVEVEKTVPAKLILGLKYESGTPAIRAIKRESRPGHRMYRKAAEMPRILNDYGIAVVSTPQGIMTNKAARKAKMGGEIICSVY
jgi:small subunit ribosomal protein S8